jgi:hypothetical protein
MYHVTVCTIVDSYSHFSMLFISCLLYSVIKNHHDSHEYMSIPIYVLYIFIIDCRGFLEEYSSVEKCFVSLSLMFPYA